MKRITFKPDCTEYIEVSPDGFVFYGKVYTPENDPSVHFASGTIDEVRVWDKALSPEELKEAYAEEV